MPVELTMITALPESIATYIEASNMQDAKNQAACFTPTATVEDESESHHGQAAIQAWAEKTHNAYNFQLTTTHAETKQNQTRVTCTIEGDFPGSPITQHFNFTIENGKIAKLSITD